ncbi:PhnE/PtxC family ABC transporter permease [Natronomonas amylolytica]|uniref:PhnE/PtxC family ABC transporter permease n=1 Tax=Natronomonas amylolytica TaxID=3108498 RepID=UPI00300BB631
MSEETAGGADDGSGRLADQLDRIRAARKRRAVGGVALLAVLGVLFYQSMSAAGTLSTQYTTGFFLESLRDFFPLTTYFGLFPFIDFSQYLDYIGQQNLLFASDISLLWSDPAQLVSEVGALIADEGIFAVFGVAGITLAMGFAGTIIGFPMALLFGVLGSERVTPFPFNFVFRGTMSAIRAIPALVWILIYIPLAGLTPVSAVLAIGTDTIGNLGRLFTDELEEIEEGPIEAMKTTGANRTQTVTFGMLSQVTTPYIAWTLYIFEINVRIAVSLGVYGAGGLGQVVETQVGLFQFTNAMATLLCIFLLIISVELLSQRVRARLRADTETMSLKELILGFPRRFAESLTK